MACTRWQVPISSDAPRAKLPSAALLVNHSVTAMTWAAYSVMLPMVLAALMMQWPSFVVLDPPTGVVLARTCK